MKLVEKEQRFDRLYRILVKLEDRLRFKVQAVVERYDSEFYEEALAKRARQVKTKKAEKLAKFTVKDAIDKYPKLAEKYHSIGKHAIQQLVHPYRKRNDILRAAMLEEADHYIVNQEADRDLLATFENVQHGLELAKAEATVFLEELRNMGIDTARLDVDESEKMVHVSACVSPSAGYALSLMSPRRGRFTHEQRCAHLKAMGFDPKLVYPM